MSKIILGICEEDEDDIFEDEELSEESQKKFSSYFSLEQNTKEHTNILLDSSFLTGHKNVPINYGAFYHSHRKIVENIIVQEDKILENEILIKQLSDKKQIKKLKREIIKAKDRLYEYFYILQSAHQNYHVSDSTHSLDGEKSPGKILFDYFFNDDDYYCEGGIDSSKNGDKTRPINYINLSDEEKKLLLDINKLGEEIDNLFVFMEKSEDEGNPEKAMELLEGIEKIQNEQEKLKYDFINLQLSKK